MRAGLTIGLLLCTPLLTAAADQPPRPTPPPPVCGDHAADPLTAPAKAILAGYGTGGFKVRTSSADAQAYFDNGMQLGHAFAHKASVAAFRRAERLDPTCAMCFWGEAWARGPTINYTIDAAEQKELKALADRAAVLASGGPDKERRLIAALQARYVNGGGDGPGDDAFARQMDALARAYPDHSEIAILAADAWMITVREANSRINLPRATGLIEAVLRRNPNDTAAIHFYIHVTERGGFGARALPYARRLQALAPAASHLVHMPSHTYYIVGDYRDAVAANVEAVRLDAANAKRLGLAEGPWKLSYHGHNVQFGAGAAMMDGDGKAALALSDQALTRLPETKPDSGWSQFTIATAYFAQGRYADGAQVAALPDPGAGLPFLRAMRHYARGEAAARRGVAAAVLAEAAQVAISRQELKSFGGGGVQAKALVQVAQLVLVGRAAMLNGHPAQAANAYRKAALIQESKLSKASDPPLWWYPVRRSYAAALLASGKPRDALREITAVLRLRPNDPLSLVVLARTNEAQGRADEARTQIARAQQGWVGKLDAVGPALV